MIGQARIEMFTSWKNAKEQILDRHDKLLPPKIDLMIEKRIAARIDINGLYIASAFPKNPEKYARELSKWLKKMFGEEEEG